MAPSLMAVQEHSLTFPGFALHQSIQTLVLFTSILLRTAYPQDHPAYPFDWIKYVGTTPVPSIRIPLEMSEEAGQATRSSKDPNGTPSQDSTSTWVS
jgi:hypothetical protein